MHITRNKNCKSYYGSELDTIKEIRNAEGKKISNKKYYQNNSQNIKESYDPAERRIKYLTEKKVEKKIKEKIQRNGSEKLAKNEVVTKFIERQENKKLYSSKWYKNNSEKVKKKQAESYAPEKRRAKYLKAKEMDDKIEKRIAERNDSDDLTEDKEVQKFHERHENKQSSMAKWYKKKSEKIKENRAKSIDSEQRKVKFQKEKEINKTISSRICDSDEDSENEFVLKEREYKKKWYKDNSERIKKKQAESYDPVERRKKFEVKKLNKAKMIKKVYEMDSDETANDKEVCDFINHGYHHESNYKKKWYKENSEKIRKKQTESYNPSKRNKKYQEEKKVKANLIKKICEKDSKELAEDKDVCRFLNKDAKEKSYKKEWYKKNSEKIKKRKAEAYDASKREKQYQKFKRKEKEYEAAESKKQAEEYRYSSSKKLENVARHENKSRRDEAKISNCTSCKTIIDMNLPEITDIKKQLEKEIEELYCKFEFEIDEIVQKGKNLDSLAWHYPLYLKLYREYPPPYGSKLVKYAYEK